jgi:putative zinc finger/helix-turn-helix YgiT family protein
MKSTCPYCEEFRAIEIVKKMEKNIIHGIEIESEAEFSLCTVCGKDFATMDQMDFTLTNGYNEYRKLENIIFPEEIISIREKYGASQKTFAKILDLKELAFKCYEQGTLTSKAVNDLIRLMELPEKFTEMFEKNKYKLSSSQIKRIENTLTKQSMPFPKNV